jgi:SNF2 family DNA or RNA helicase
LEWDLQIKQKNLLRMEGLKIKTDLMGHQKEIMKFTKMRPVSMNFSETGTGKTLAAISLAFYRYRNAHIDTVIIISPKNVLLTWQDQLLEHVGEIPDWFYLFSYDFVRYHQGKHLPQYDPKKTLLILDECRYIRYGTSKRTQTLLSLQHIMYKHFLDATPIEKGLFDLFFPFKIANVWPFNKMGFEQFKREYFFSNGLMKQYRIKELLGIVNNLTIRITKDQCLDLPPKLYTNRWYDFSPEQIALYEKLRKKTRAEIYKPDGSMITIQASHLNKIQKFLQICSGFCYSDDGTWIAKKNPKLEVLEKIINHLDQPALIWVYFDQEEKMIAELFQKKKISFGILGSSKVSQKHQTINAFMAGKFDYLICKLQSVSAGLNLQRASVSIFFANPLSMNVRVQGEDRNHRIGSKNKVTYIDLLARDKADDLLRQKLIKKWTDADLLLRILSHENRYR